MTVVMIMAHLVWGAGLGLAMQIISDGKRAQLASEGASWHQLLKKLTEQTIPPVIHVARSDRKVSIVERNRIQNWPTGRGFR